jgi:pimeloyl-ACP methyl ester carboxylesterase
MADPTFVLVHGAWHGAWAWDHVTPLLAEAGRSVVTVELPSAGHDAHTLGDLDADVAAVRTVLDGIEGDKILVGHSYGGIPITVAPDGRDDVTHLVYLCAFQLDEGESLLGALGGEVPPWIELVADGVASKANDADVICYADVDAAIAEQAKAQLALQSVASFATPVPVAAWKWIPSTYVICDQDQAIPPPAQEQMAQRSPHVHHLDSSHSPFFSMPQRVVDLLVATG